MRYLQIWLTERIVAAKTFFRQHRRLLVLLIVIVGMLPAFVSWRLWWPILSTGTTNLGVAVISFGERHPQIGIAIQALFNAVPDAVPLLLALAGLGYCMPEVTKKIENSKPSSRYRLLAVLILFVFFVIAINSTNRTVQDRDKKTLNDKIIALGKSVSEIQGDLLANKTGMLTEAERKKQIEKTLRDQYIISHDPIDPEIVSGNANPPEDWMNAKLHDLGEHWAFKSAPKTAETRIVQELAPPEKKAQVVFSFYQADMSGEPQTTKVDPMMDDTFSASVTAVVKGDVPAENLQIWIRECQQCEWGTPMSANLSSGDAEHPFDKGFVIQELQPNVGLPKWDLTIHFPHFPRYDAVAISCFYSCKNCAPVDWRKPQNLWVTKTMAAGFKLRSPSIFYAPEPVH